VSCAIYIRKSREEKDKPSHRLTVQREQLPAHATSQGWPYTIYDDGHASAARGKTEDLKERARLEADIRAGKIERIICIELSRLSRDDSLQDYVAWLHLCAEHGVKLATLSRSLDPSQHSDWMLLLMEGGFSSVEMKILKARMKEGRDQALQEGKFLGGKVPPPYRYDLNQCRPVVDPQELPRMEKIWSLATEMSNREISRKTGLALITIRRMLAPERLLFCQALRKSGGELLPCDWQPVLTQEQVDRITANRVTRQRGYARATAAGLLSNLNILFCGYCNSNLRAFRGRDNRSGKNSPYAYYACKGTGLDNQHACEPARMIRQEDIDSRVITHLLRTLENIDGLKAAWYASQDTSSDNKEYQQLMARNMAQTTRKQRLIAAIADGVIDFADAKQQRQAIESDLEEIRQQQKILQTRRTNEPAWDELRLSAEDFKNLNTENQRQLLKLCIKQLRVYRSYLTIEYLFPRGTDNNTAARIHLPPGLKPGRKTQKSP